ncbi:MAG: hypothetical protein ACUZ77_03725 [Candidatus Brocadiales bacterium]
MLTNYIQAAMRQAKYEILKDDGTFYGEISGFDGPYVSGKHQYMVKEETKKQQTQKQRADVIEPFK